MLQVATRNLWTAVTFTLDDQLITRQLVPEVRDFSAELSVESPIGAVLVAARAGDELVVSTPGGYSVVKVLAVN